MVKMLKVLTTTAVQTDHWGILVQMLSQYKQREDYVCAHCQGKFAQEPDDQHPYLAACGVDIHYACVAGHTSQCLDCIRSSREFPDVDREDADDVFYYMRDEMKEEDDNRLFPLPGLAVKDCNKSNGDH